MKVHIQALHPEALQPVYATSGAACFDLHACTINGQRESVTLLRGRTAVIGTGLAFEIPDGHVMLIYGRSGHGFKNHARLTNAVGVIDADYRGEVMVKLGMDDLAGAKEPELLIHPGDRIAQAIVLPYPRVSFEWVQELGSTQRGAGGFGSSGQ
jgi:dUTP pyrophosphatase